MNGDNDGRKRGELEFLVFRSRRISANDWFTAFAVVLLRAAFAQQVVSPTIYTYTFLNHTSTDTHTAYHIRFHTFKFLSLSLSLSPILSGSSVWPSTPSRLEMCNIYVRTYIYLLWIQHVWKSTIQKGKHNVIQHPVCVFSFRRPRRKLTTNCDGISMLAE